MLFFNSLQKLDLSLLVQSKFPRAMALIIGEPHPVLYALITCEETRQTNENPKIHSIQRRDVTYKWIAKAFTFG